MLQAVSDVVVSVVEFCNLELARKGVYRVEFTVGGGGVEGGDRGTPYSTLGGGAPLRSRIGRRWIARSDEIADAARLRVSSNSFVTRSMLVRFNEERFELAEGACFKVERDAGRSAWPLLLGVRLLHAPVEESGAPPALRRAGLFNSLELRRLRVATAGEGVHEYVPVLFGGENACLVGIVVHHVLLNVRFCAPPPPPPPPPPLPPPEGASKDVGGIVAMAASWMRGWGRPSSGSIATAAADPGVDVAGGGGGGAAPGGGPPASLGALLLDDAARASGGVSDAATRARAPSRGAPLPPAVPGEGSGGAVAAAAARAAAVCPVHSCRLLSSREVAAGHRRVLGPLVASFGGVARFAACLAANAAAPRPAAPRLDECGAGGGRFRRLDPPCDWSMLEGGGAEGGGAEGRGAEGGGAEGGGAEGGGAEGGGAGAARLAALPVPAAVYDCCPEEERGASSRGCTCAPPPDPGAPAAAAAAGDVGGDGFGGAPPFSARCRWRDGGRVGEAIEAEARAAAGELFGLWQQTLQALSADGTPVLLDGLCARWLRDSAMFWRQRVASCRRLACEEVAGEQDCTATQALADISSVFPPPDATMQVADLGIFGGASVPLVCEDRYVAGDEHRRKHVIDVVGAPAVTVLDSYETAAPGKLVHVWFFQNGLFADRTTWTAFRAVLRLRCPGHVLHAVIANEDGATGDDIEVCAERFAREVEATLHEKVILSGGTVSRLSFVGHSLGGVIIRAALRQATLYSYRDRFHSLVLLASPCLGVLYSATALVETGTYVMKKLRKCTSLEQLACTDVPGRPADGWLPRMTSGASILEGEPGRFPSAGAVVSCFRHVLLCSSMADAYSPFFSCRAEMCEQARKDKALGGLYAELLGHFWAGVDARRVIKVDVDFALGGGVSVDSVIGRAAHIAFITSEKLPQLLIALYPDVFL